MAEYLRIPGFFDVHVHLREPGGFNKEGGWVGIETEGVWQGSLAAVAGGVVGMIGMPNTATPIATPEVLQQFFRGAEGRMHNLLGTHFLAIPDSAQYFEQVNDDIFGYKIYLDKTTGGYVVSRDDAPDVINAIPENKILIAHSQGESLRWLINHIIGRDLALHITHVSLQEEAEMIDEAKQKGMNITADTTPHHLTLTQDCLATLGPYGVMLPPLASETDREAMWKHLLNGVIDFVTTDHAPHKKERKQGDKPATGVPGLDTALPLMVAEYKRGRISLEQLVKVMFINPTTRFRVAMPTGTFVEVDLQEEQVVSEQTLYTRVGWSPFVGMSLPIIRRTVIGGVEAYKYGDHQDRLVGRVIKPAA